jgi:hypothetical protein
MPSCVDRPKTRLRRSSTATLVIALAALSMAPAVSAAADAPPAGSVLDAIERTIVKEPAYQSAPRYALLLLGTKATAKVWLVEDGKVLYVDRNGNGDLTDDGPPVRQSKLRVLGPATRYDCEYDVGVLAPADGSHHTDFNMARWNYGDSQDGYGLSLKVDGVVPMYAGWTPFWAGKPGDAPMMHFGGPLKPVMLRLEGRPLGPTNTRLSVAFVNAGRGDGAKTRLSIDALPPDAVPEARVDWPVAQGAAPLRTTHALASRCCYWEFYDVAFKAPGQVVAGKARVTVVVPRGALPFELTTDTIEVDVAGGAGR